jgi:hypothetical protein
LGRSRKPTTRPKSPVGIPHGEIMATTMLSHLNRLTPVFLFLKPHYEKISGLTLLIQRPILCTHLLFVPKLRGCERTQVNSPQSHGVTKSCSQSNLYGSGAGKAQYHQ